MQQKFTTYLQEKSGLDMARIEQLAKKLVIKTLHKGDVLLRPGEICRYTFFVQQGLLRSYTIDEAGKEHIIQFAPEAWFIVDRSSSFFNQPSELFIDAIENTEVVYIEQGFVSEVSAASPEFAAFNNQALHSHIMQQQKRINMLLGATAEQRYLDFIKMYPNLTLRIPQWMIASYLGVTPESLSRVRKDLARRNFSPKLTV